jgi:predicted O-methyltransferase YrrM
MEDYAARERFPIIGPICGQLCYQVARMIGAQQVFELGSGFGYSTAWFAQAVRENGGGTVHHVVWDAELSKRARKHLSELGYEDIMQYTIGEAVAALKETPEPCDLIFNDIDKVGYPASLPIIKEKLRSGGVLIIDNMLWSGRVLDRTNLRPNTEAIRVFTDMITNDEDWIVSLVPIRDGLIIAMKK